MKTDLSGLNTKTIKINENFQKLHFHYVGLGTTITAVYKPEKDSNVEIISKILLISLLEADVKIRVLRGFSQSVTDVGGGVDNSAIPVLKSIILDSILNMVSSVGELKLDDDNILEIKLENMGSLVASNGNPGSAPYVSTVDGYVDDGAVLRKVKKVTYKASDSSKTFSARKHDFLLFPIANLPEELDLKTDNNIVRFTTDLLLASNIELFGAVFNDQDQGETEYGFRDNVLIPIDKVKEFTVLDSVKVADFDFYLLS